MLSKRKRKPEMGAASEQKFSATTKSSKRGKTGVPSIISADLRIKGTIDSEGEVQFDGKMEGNLRSASLIIGEKAVIDGDIVANDVTIRGRVNGNIRARMVKLSGTAHVKGDILQKSLSVETGAVLDGRCKHVDDPLSASIPKSRGPRVDSDNESGVSKVFTMN
jgi:cytoskeletal protein CcmA (bactofilin family)